MDADALLSGGHRQQMVDRHARELRRGAGGQAFGKVIRDEVVRGEQPLADGKADGGGDDALGDGKEGVAVVRAEGSEIPFRDAFAVAQQEEGVRLLIRFVFGETLEEAEDVRAADAGGLGGGGGQKSHTAYLL